MSQENVEVVRALADAWNAGEHDPGRIPDYFDPAIRIESPLASVRGEAYVGYAGIEHWMNDLDEQFIEWAVAIDEVRPVGGTVVMLGSVNARGRASGAPLEFDSAIVYDFTGDHRIIRVRIYPDAHEALKAVGLAE